MVTLTKNALYKVGVILLDEEEPPKLKCKLCGEVWEAHPEADKLYYRCPNGCNNLM